MTQQMTTPIEPEEKRRLLGLCLIGAKQLGFIPKEVTDLHNDRLLQLYKEWGGDKWAQNFKPYGSKLIAEDASGNFLAFLKKKAGELANRLVDRSIKIERLTVTLDVPISDRGGRMLFTAEGIPPEDMDREEVKVAYQLLMAEAIIGYEEFIDHPPHFPTKRKFEAVSGSNTDTFMFSSIVSKTEGSKRGFFVKGGKFSLWGVRVFPPVLSLAGIDVESINGEKFIAGVAQYTVKANGDPDLVIGMTLGVQPL